MEPNEQPLVVYAPGETVIMPPDRRPARLGSVEKLPCGGAILHYPGHPSRRYQSTCAAYNRRRRIELGLKVELPIEREGTWTPEEDRLLASLWGTLTRAEYPERIPGRSYKAAKSRARKLKLKADRYHKRAGGERLSRFMKQRYPWTPEQIRIVAECPRSVAKTLLAGKKSPEDIYRLARRLNLPHDDGGKGWSAAELDLIRSMERAVRRLREQHGRTQAAISNARLRFRTAEERTNAAVRAVQAATAHLAADVRRDVEGEVMVQILAREITTEALPDAVRKAVTRIYGPRHLSLDAPLDGVTGTTWIDTIASDRLHF